MLEREREEKWKKIEAIRDELMREGMAGAGQTSAKSKPERDEVEGSVTPTNPEEENEVQDQNDAEDKEDSKESDATETDPSSKSNT